MPRLKPAGYAVVSLLIGGILLALISITGINLRRLELHWYDLTNSNLYVKERKQILDIFSGFNKIKLEEIPKEFRNPAGMSQKDYKKAMRGHLYYVLQKKDLYKKIAGDNRLMSLVSGDNGYRHESLFSEKQFYLDLNIRVLYRFLDIQDILENKGFNRDAITIISGHRTPNHNASVGGKKESRHLNGDSIDLKIGDINNDGSVDSKDKKLLIPILEHVIGNRGGVGIYTMSVHIDLRGHRSRW